MSEIKNAIIRKAEIQISDHGFLTIWLMLDYSKNSTQGFGGYSLLGQDFDTGGFWIKKILEIADVMDWSKLAGKCVRVKGGGFGKDIQAIGHITEDKWFNPKEEFKEKD